MKRFWGLWALLILMFASCGKLPETAPNPTEGSDCRLTLALAVPDAERITRTLTPDDEKSVADINLYLFGDAFDKHYFCSPCAVSLNMTVPPGTYELYLIANAGADLGDMTLQQAESYRYEIASEGDIEKNGRMMMYARQTVTVTNDTNLNVELVRLAAKVEIRYSVTPSAGALRLHSIQVKSAPTGVRVFDRNRAATAVADYPAHALTGNAGTLTAYVLENCQGINSAVTSQKLKDSAHAPQNSTYVVIKGVYANKAVAYTVYLGENATSDFNVRENRHYVLNVQIYGTNPSDFRVSVSEFTATPLNASYRMGETVVSTLLLSAVNDPDNFRILTYTLTSGKANVSIDGAMQAPGTAIPFLSGSGTRQARVGIEALQPGAVGITFTMKDQWGVELTQSIATTFIAANPIVITSTPMPEPYAHHITPFAFTISEEGYTGNFEVTFSRLNGPDDGLNFNGTILPTDYTATVASGSYPMAFTSDTFLGNMCTRVVATDDYGQQTTYLIQQEITPLPITIVTQVRTGTISTPPTNGIFAKPSYADVTYTFSYPLPYETTIPHELTYEMEYTRVPPSYLNKKASGAVTVPANRVSYTERIVYDDQYAPQYHYVGGVETLLRRGHIITNNTTLNLGEIRPQTSTVTYTVSR